MNKADNDIRTAILYVIAVVSNPAQFNRRYQLFNEFCERMNKESQIKLITLELQQNNRPFMTNSQIKLRTNDEIWYKENLINIAVSRLPDDWKYLAWIDADIEFVNKNWVQDTINALQTYKVLQNWSHAIDMGVKQETLQVHNSFMYLYCNGEDHQTIATKKNYSFFFHPGFSWSITRQAYDEIGGLMDFCVLGSADHSMALAFIGLVEKSLHAGLHENYKILARIFQDRCDKFIKKNVGYVHGTILHHFHGNKVDRKYTDRWNILIKNKFDPLRDIIKDSKGLYHLEGDKIKFRDEIIRYFRERNEDSNTMPVDYKYVKKEWI